MTERQFKIGDVVKCRLREGVIVEESRPPTDAWLRDQLLFSDIRTKIEQLVPVQECCRPHHD